jgi:23S rRNA (cytidine1920-2'-O)/16S rRNA (cytidine1409-2'-O)-methyltransferase
MPAVAKLLKPGAEIMCLIKPQFEAGRELVGKKGVVRDSAVHEQVIRGILDFMPTIGFSVCALDYSPITGPEGNIEFLLYMKNTLQDPAEVDIAALVKSAHTELKK